MITENFLNRLKPVRRFSFQHLEANFKNLLGMELISDLTLQFLSSVNNDLFICLFLVFFTGVGCEIQCVGTTTDILYVSVRVACAIKFNII